MKQNRVRASSFAKLIINMAIGLAENAVRRNETHFNIGGRQFEIVQLVPGECYVTCEERDAGIRIVNGRAMVA